MHAKRILIAGAGGRLGAALVRHLARAHRVIAMSRAELDLAQTEALGAILARHDFDLLINCAAQTNVDRCEREPAEAFLLNAEAPRRLAEICTSRNARMIHLSTDYVFDGAKAEPYTEEDQPRPLSVYGSSKWEGERYVLRAGEQHLVARVSWVFGPDRPSFIDWVIDQAKKSDQVAAIADKYSTPSYTLDLSEMLARLLDVPEGGLVHICNQGECSWQEYGQWALDCCAAEGIPLRATTVDAQALCDMAQFIAQRPLYTVLSTAKYERLTAAKPRAWQEAVRAYVREHVLAARNQ